MKTYDNKGNQSRGTLTPVSEPNTTAEHFRMIDREGPCDDCPHFRRCADQGLACPALYVYVNQDEQWAKKARQEGEGGEWREYLDRRIPSAAWLRRLSLRHSREFLA